jgi:hypothetical protein
MVPPGGFSPFCGPNLPANLLQAEFVISKFFPSVRGVSDSEKPDPLGSLLSSFALGPSWARAVDHKPDHKQKAFAGGDDRPPRRDDRGGDRRDDRGGDRGRPPGGRDDRRRSGGNYEERRSGPPPRQEVYPEEGVRVTIAPDAQAVHLIGKEIHQVARVYPLFDVAKILLADKTRCRAIFEATDEHPPLAVGKLEESVFLSQEEAVRHLWNSKLRDELLEEETIEVDPPTGNFQVIARCGISGEWLGPVNFHSYQTNLRRLHRERFARMSFEIYAAKVRTERGEEAVNAWLETTKKKTRWRIKGDDDDAWMDDRAAAEKAFGARCFEKAFTLAKIADVSGAIAPENLSPSLFASLRMSGSHARNHPAILIPAVCRAVEIEHLPVFKRKGKLHTGPARPHPLPLNAVLAERPGQMVTWIRENPPAKLEGLWKSVLPEGSTAPPAEYAADLFWLLHQGHILLFTDDTLVVQDGREANPAPADDAPKKSKKKRKNRKGKTASDGSEPSDAMPSSGEIVAGDGSVALATSSELAASENEAVPHASEALETPTTEADPPTEAAPALRISPPDEVSSTAENSPPTEAAPPKEVTPHAEASQAVESVPQDVASEAAPQSVPTSQAEASSAVENAPTFESTPTVEVTPQTQSPQAIETASASETGPVEIARASEESSDQRIS